MLKFNKTINVYSVQENSIVNIISYLQIPLDLCVAVKFHRYTLHYLIVQIVFHIYIYIYIYSTVVYSIQ